MPSWTEERARQAKKRGESSGIKNAGGGGAAFITLAFTLFSTTGLVVIDNAFENLSHSV